MMVGVMMMVGVGMMEVGVGMMEVGVGKMGVRVGRIRRAMRWIHWQLRQTPTLAYWIPVGLLGRD
jgi:hypothetical protein